jgi:4-amino-4-deoxy-L-arabinose transferase-like glycosyltransferase
MGSTVTVQAPALTIPATWRGIIARHPDRVALIALLLIGAGVRLAFTFRAPIFLVHDSVTYFQSGYDFARGYGFELAFKRTPLYPVFIAGVVAVVGEDLQALAFVQHMLGLVSIALTYFLARVLSGRAAAMVAGLLVALSGPLLLYEHYILAEPLFTALLLAFGLVLVRAVQTGRWHWLVLSGIVLGLASLSRPVGQAALLAVPVGLLVAMRSWRRAALASGLVVLGFGFVSVPWMVRNFATNGSFESAGAIGQTLTGRIALHDEGFVIPAPDSPSPYDDPVKTEARALVLRQMARDARPSAINHRLRNTFGWTEAQANRLMRDVALEILVAQRERYVTGTFIKARRLLWGEEIDLIGDHWSNRKSGELRESWVSNPTIAHLLTPPTPQQESEKWNAAAMLRALPPHSIRWPLFFLLVAGLVAGWRSQQRWGTVFIAALVLALVFPSAALVGYEPRYRYPLDPFLAILIGGGVVGVARLVARWASAAGNRKALDAILPERERPVAAGSAD